MIKKIIYKKKEDHEYDIKELNDAEIINDINVNEDIEPNKMENKIYNKKYNEESKKEEKEEKKENKEKEDDNNVNINEIGEVEDDIVDI